MGVSERGFSNFLHLQYRSSGIEITGYEYDRLYRFAEDIGKRLKENKRVCDIVIETSGQEQGEDELYMDYNKGKSANDSVDMVSVHEAVADMLKEHEFEKLGAEDGVSRYVLRPSETGSFDLWQLENSFVKVGGRDIRLSDYMSIERRKSKNCIPRKNQEYVLRVAFNMLSSNNYANGYIKSVVDYFNAKLPVGFRCKSTRYIRDNDDTTQYWLIGIVVAVVFFICSIMFESLKAAMAIVSIVPISFIGLFLTFHFCGLEFGAGGFAAC